MKKKKTIAAKNSISSGPPSPDSNHRNFPVVAIGASAGGVEALKEFFESMPEGAGIAFIVIQHLDPERQSLMAEILSRSTTMTVTQAVHDSTIEPDHIYVTPPGKQLILKQGRILLEELSKNKLLSSHCFDELLRSMAAEQGDHSICIILSGAGTDGSLGLKKIKEAGGMVMVQAPNEAGSDGMPRSAINTGLVDYVLPVPSMPGELVQYVRHGYYRNRDSALTPAEEVQSQVDAILDFLNKKRSIDFTAYKRGTLVRRIERRMNLLHVQDIESYGQRLRQDDQELDALARDLFIVVTSFFRDKDALSLLYSKVIAPLCFKAVPGTPIRVWVPGVATGEEAYSLAILILEELDRGHKSDCDLQIFATDIDAVALEHARSGIFRGDIEADVSTERLDHFFDKCNTGYQIKKYVRDKITFAEQDLTRDPPFSRIDLISCRNLLIYLKAEAQSRILSLFHFALRPSGVLFLGNAESVGRAETLFRPIEKKWRIFKKIDSVRVPLFNIPWPQKGGGGLQESRVGNTRALNLKELGEGLLLKNFSPCGVIVNHANEVVQYIGNTNAFLHLPEGDPTINLLAMVPDVVRTPLRGMLHDLVIQGHAPSSALVRLPDLEGKPYRQIKISAQRIEEQGVARDLILVVFAELPSDCEIILPELDSYGENVTAHEIIIRQLEEELLQTRRNLESTIEKMEAVNEELKANNEELMSMNEEIQSTNEELETSKEELQSINEELATVNAQLNDKVTELEETNNDLDNLLANSEVGFLFLDEQLRIKRFTPVVQNYLHIFPADLGRPLQVFTTTFGESATSVEDATKVLGTLIPIEKEMQTQSGRWLLQRVLPYRTWDNHIKGVLVTFQDITALKRKEDAARQAALLKGLNDTLPLRLAYIDANERHLFANKAYRDGFSFKQDEVLGLPLLEVTGKAFYQAASPFIRKALAGKNVHFEQSFEVPGQDRRDLLCNFSPHFDDSGNVTGFFVMLQDMTEFRQAESNMAWLSAIVESCHDAILSRSCDGIIQSWNCGAEQMFGYTAAEIVGQKIDILFSSEQDEGFDGLELLCRGVGAGHAEPRCHAKEGREITVLLTQSPILDQNDQPAAVSVIMSDLCASKEAERQLHRLNKDLESKVAERTIILQQQMVQLRRMAQALTQTEQRERQRLASVLHNDLQQLLVAAGLRLERLANSEADTDKHQAIQQVEALIGQAVTATRSLSTDLKPPILNSDNLENSLHWLADWLWKRFDFSLKVTLQQGLHFGDIPDEDIAFLFDSVRELCFNIVKHAHVKEGNLVLQRTEEDRLVLSVTDNGVGMDLEQPYQSPAVEGGMGLNAMRDRLSMIGGELTISSAVGQGFRADILLPYSIKSKAKAKRDGTGKRGTSNLESDQGSGRKKDLPSGRKIRVMLVDDHTVVRDGLKMILQDEEDIDVIGEASDGEKALRLADKLLPDVIVMDVNMPRMSGVEATKLIKLDHPDISIVALSINDDPGTYNAMLNAGACAYFNKSGSSSDVCEVIRACKRSRVSVLPPLESQPEK